MQDRRVRFKNATQWRRDVFYPLPTNESILSLRDPRIASALANSPPRQRAYLALRPMHAAAVVVLVLLLCGPLLWLAWRSLGKRGNANHHGGAGQQ